MSHFILVGFINDFGFGRIILKCDNEINSRCCASSMCWCGSDSTGPPEGDHMANGRVEMAGFQLNKTQACASQITVRYSAGITAFATQNMNKIRIGRDGKNERAETNWKKMEREPVAQLGENFWFRKNKEDGVSSFASCITQGMFVGHHDRTGAAFAHHQERSCAGQKLDETDTERCITGRYELDGLCGTMWHMVAPELKLTEKVRGILGPVWTSATADLRANGGPASTASELR